MTGKIRKKFLSLYLALLYFEQWNFMSSMRLATFHTLRTLVA